MQVAAVNNADPPEGSLHPVTVTVAPGTAGQEFELGFFQSDVGQLGPSWQAAGWMATSVGALATQKDISALQVSWKTSGYIDGPSAGGLMTAMFISALQGEEMKKDVAMTGTINPDGSIGPVGGITYKLDAVIKEGKKTFLIPIGQRYDVDADGQTVDLVNKGQLAGVTVKEVSDINEAYELLTGKELAHVQAPSRAPDLSPAVYDRMKPKVLDWFNEYSDAAGRFSSEPDEVKNIFADQATEIQASADRAQKALNEGDVAGAYGQIQQATAGMNGLALGARAVTVMVQTQDVNQAETALLQNAGASRVDTLIEKLKATQPCTPEEGVLVVSAWSSALQALALDNAAQTALEQAKQQDDEGERFKYLFIAAFYNSSEKYIAKAADDVLTFNVGTGTASGQKVDPQALEHWSTVFKHAAEANLANFDSLIVEDYAQQMGVRTEQVKAALLANDLNYQVATWGASPAALDYLEKHIGKGPAFNYAQMGFGVGSYLAASELIAKYYSLDAKEDDNGNVVGFGRDRALSAMLDSASNQANVQIATVEKAGGDPSLPIVMFQAARYNREGSASDKLSALDNYWSASTYARLLTLIAQKKT